MTTIHGLALPQVLEMRRALTSTTLQQVIINRNQPESKTIMTGEEFEIIGLGSFSFVDQLEALNAKNWIVWMEDSDRGNRHGLMEVESNRNVEDAKASYRIHLLIQSDVCDPTIVDPKVAA
jgi:hypothetical protein